MKKTASLSVGTLLGTGLTLVGAHYGFTSPEFLGSVVGGVVGGALIGIYTGYLTEKTLPIAKKMSKLAIGSALSASLISLPSYKLGSHDSSPQAIYSPTNQNTLVIESPKGTNYFTLSDTNSSKYIPLEEFQKNQLESLKAGHQSQIKDLLEKQRAN